MYLENEFSKISGLIGDKARSIMLWSLLDGKAYTATELAVSANVSRQSASNHLSKLMQAELVAVEKQGRHRYFRLANEQVAQVVESIAGLIPNRKIEIRRSAAGEKLAFARTCYDHLAGELSIHLTRHLLENKIVMLNNTEFEVTEPGSRWFGALGIDVETLRNKKRSFAHTCLDWTEREYHIAGALGAAILQNFLAKDWVRRKGNTRELIITGLGQTKLYGELKIMSCHS